MLKLTAALTLFIISGLSYALDGFYVGAGMALNQTSSNDIYKTYYAANGSGSAVGSYLGNQNKDSVGTYFNGGYQFNDYFATEVNFLWSNNQVYQPSPQDTGNKTFLGSQNLFAVNALFLYPFTDLFDLKIRGGVAFERATMTDYVGSPMTDGFTSVLGIGGAFYIFKHISLDLDYINYGLLLPLNLHYNANGNNVVGGNPPTNAATVENNDLVLSINYHF